ncbi:MAG TPA: gluconate 2-dehydrogenase subunit 3 family protein [Candidatus Nanoarchaeia archaeon]|nr:gluconate 2-dehydrogenase subunit 3 family protein [Candidatus Nanoarchaeia archaeon]
MSDEKKEPNQSRRQFIKYGVAGAVGFGLASAVEVPILSNALQSDNNTVNQQKTQISDLNGQVSNLKSQNSDLQNQLTNAQQLQGFLTLNPNEQVEVEAIVEAMIPSDSSGPGAKEAGVIYFIDHQLAGSYGKAGNMFMQGPFVHPQTGSLSVGGITYSGGTIMPRLQAGTAYQYPFNPREFWRQGLMSLQTYCNAAYGGNFENLSSSQQTQVLQDLFDNSATNTNLQTAFTAPNAAEFFNEIHDMTTAGFWTDPLLGGNQGMVGWTLLAFNANYWGDDIGLGPAKLMTAGTPTRLTPKSLSQLQAEGGGM